MDYVNVKGSDDNLKKICDPAECDECVYVGEGGFLCTDERFEQEIVVEDFEPTEHYMRCQKGRKGGKHRRRKKL